MSKRKVALGDLLYHSTHGLCRVNQLINENRGGQETLCYVLVPKIATRAKTRFVIEDTSLQASGFHPLVSVREANKILDYLTAGEIETVDSNSDQKLGETFIQDHNALGFAKKILILCRQDFEGKNKRSRQALERSTKGLVGEFAYVFKITLKEASEKIQKCLRNISKVNPLVFSILEQVGGN